MEKTTYTEGVVGSVKSLNPLFETTEAESELNTLVFRSLTKLDKSGKLQLDLAESVQEVTPTEYVFKLKKNVFWHDGKNFTAGDVVYTVESSQDAKLATTAKTVFKDIKIEKIDDYTVKFKLREPFAPFLSQTTVGIIPAHIPLSSYKPIGTGNFRVADFTPEKLVLSNGRLDLVFRFYMSAERAVLALKQGEVKALGGLEKKDLEQLAGFSNYQLYSKTMPTRLTAVFFNTKAEAVSDKLVRQALSYATAKSSLIKVADGGSVIAAGPLASGNSLQVAEKEHFPFDLSKAAILLDKAGWKLEKGKRTKDGKHLSLTLTTAVSDQYQSLAKEIGKSWSILGIDYQVLSLQPGEMDQGIKDTQFQLVLTTEAINFDPDQYVLWHSTQVRQGNLTVLSSPKVDKLLEDARKRNDNAFRKEKYAEFVRILADESPAIFLYYPTYNWLVNKKVSNIRLDRFVTPADRFQNASEWKIPRFAI